MSFILTSQTANDQPYSYQNNFCNTIEIRPNSKIALNHVTPRCSTAGSRTFAILRLTYL